MSLNIGMITVDCHKPRELAEFWTKALGTATLAESDDFVILLPTEGHSVRMGFQRVDDDHSAKNRLHLDIEADSDDDAKEEVKRLVSLGGSVIAERSHPGAPEHGVPAFSWTVVADPEGNQFCVGARQGG